MVDFTRYWAVPGLPANAVPQYTVRECVYDSYVGPVTGTYIAMGDWGQFEEQTGYKGLVNLYSIDGSGTEGSMHLLNPAGPINIETDNYGPPGQLGWNGCYPEGGPGIGVIELLGCAHKKNTVVKEVGKLADTAVSFSLYGNVIPFSAGTRRLKGDLVWATSLQADVTTSTVQSGSNTTPVSLVNGGTDSTTTDQYTTTRTYNYTANFAVCFGQGVDDGRTRSLLHLYVGGKLAYDATGTQPVTLQGINFRFYPGTETQGRDPLISSVEGEDYTPAYRDRIMVVFERFPIQDFNNQIPEIYAVVVDHQTGSNFVVPFDMRGPAPTGSDANYGGVDWVRGLYYGLWYNGGTFDIVTYDLQRTAEITRAEVSPWVGGPIMDWGISPDLGVIAFNVGLSNSSTIYIADIATGKILCQWGINSNSLASTDNSVPLAGRFRWFTVTDPSGGTTWYLASCGYLGSLAIFQYDAAGQVLTRKFYHDDAGITGMPVVLYPREAVGYTDLAFPAGKTVKTVRVGSTDTSVATAFDTNDGLLGSYDVAWLWLSPLSHNLVVWFDSPYAFNNAWARSYTLKDNLASTDRPKWNSANYWELNVPADQPAYQNGLVLPNSATRDSWFMWRPRGTRYVIAPGIEVDADTLEVRIFSTDTQGYSIAGVGIYDGQTHTTTYSVDYGGDNPLRIYWEVSSNQGMKLSEWITALCVRGGYTLDEVSVSNMDDAIYGGVVTDRAQLRDLLDPIGQAYSASVYESAGTIKMVRTNRNATWTPDRTLTTDEMLVLDASTNTALSTTRTQDMELPNILDLKYMDPGNGYDWATQSAKRITAPIATQKALSSTTLQVSVVIAADAAASLAYNALYDQWEARITHKFKLDQSQLDLEPGDFVGIYGGPEEQYAVQLTKVTVGADWTQEVEAQDVRTDITINLKGYGGRTLPQTVVSSTVSAVTILDIPIVWGKGDDLGGTALRVYYSGRGVGQDNWPGAEIYVAYGANAPADIGFDTTELMTAMVLTPLSPPINPGTTDKDSRLEIYPRTGAMDAIAGTDYLGLMNETNLAVVGAPGRWEIISFQTVFMNFVAGTFRLTNFLRGLYGTDGNTGLHQRGDTFIVLDRTKIEKLAIPLEQLGSTLNMKAVGEGQIPSASAVTTQTIDGAAEKPFPVADIRATWSGADVVLTWQRQDRFGATSWDTNFGTQPLSEATEAYEVEIWADTTLKHTITGLTSPTATYTNAQQVTDGNVIAGTITVKIFQMSATVGRGNSYKVDVYVGN